jgi:hypothetical protein
MSEKALEICRNLNSTIKKLGSEVVGDSILRENSIHATTRPSKSSLENKLKYILKTHNIKRNQL